MKSDREFLDGIYAKAEELKFRSDMDNDFELKGRDHTSVQKPHASSVKYVKYASMAAGIMLLLSSAFYIDNLVDKNKLEETPIPRNFKIISYTDQLIEDATDIIAINANYNKDGVALNIIKSYKKSTKKSLLQNHLNNTEISLTEGQTAIVFINADSKEAPILDIFLLDADNNRFINPNGESITEELLIKITK